VGVTILPADAMRIGALHAGSFQLKMKSTSIFGSSMEAPIMVTTRMSTMKISSMSIEQNNNIIKFYV
jgi:hypothetical protein